MIINIVTWLMENEDPRWEEYQQHWMESVK
jgi:hypothetical protein